MFPVEPNFHGACYCFMIMLSRQSSCVSGLIVRSMSYLTRVSHPAGNHRSVGQHYGYPTLQTDIVTLWNGRMVYDSGQTLAKG